MWLDRLMSSIQHIMCLFVFFPLFPEVTAGHIARINAELPQGCKLEGVFFGIKNYIILDANLGEGKALC